MQATYPPPKIPSAPSVKSTPVAPPELPGSRARYRLGFVFFSTFVFFCVAVLRLIQLQVFPNPELSQLAQRQFQKVGKISPSRLAVLDRNREELAVSIPASSVFARPKLMPRKRKAVAKVLAHHLGGTVESWVQKLDPKKNFVWISRQLSIETAQSLLKLNLPGIYIEPENRRIYPGSELAAPVIGFTDIDGIGISGLELALNQELIEKAEKYSISRDGKGNPSYIDSRYAGTSPEKLGVMTTIDRRLQHAVEEELERAFEEFSPAAVGAVVMDPFTGEIFAMAQKPGFDLNIASKTAPTLHTNRLVSHLFEPGSTLKVILSSYAMEQGLLNPKSLIDCENGKMQIGSETVNEAGADHRFGKIPLEQVIRYSSNIGAVKVAQTLGSDRLQAALSLFGLTEKTGILLPGEAVSSPKGEKFWRPIHLATVGFGQGISVTPLQMVTAYSPFANGGYLVRPKILMRELANENSDRLDVRRVISPETAKKVTQMLVGVTEEPGGTGEAARVPEIHVAGKTGTAQKYAPGVGYQSGKYFSSFIGYLPAERPELLIGVMVDEPSTKFYASEVAAPVFARIAERGLNILDKLPKKNFTKSASEIAKNFQKPQRSAVETAASPKWELAANGKWIMPNVLGLSLRESVNVLSKRVTEIKVAGSGYVSAQSPVPGDLIDDNAKISIQLSSSP